MARTFASLDHISRGRACWNVVTSWSDAEARNFGLHEHIDQATRYERAREFVQVVFGLWDSWDEDAFLRDKASGIYFDPDRMHVLNHKGNHFSVRGPLNMERPVQGRCVISQAGTSATGQELAAATADVIFAPSTNIEASRAYYASVKGRMAKHGRAPDMLKILPGFSPVVARTDAEARAKQELLADNIDETLGLSLLSSYFGDLSGLPLDAPIPDLAPIEGDASVDAFRRMALDGAIIYELYRFAGARSWFQSPVGAPETVADILEEWFTTGACGSFNIVCADTPAGADDFVDLVVPILQKRGLFRTDYVGGTLRETLGLGPIATRSSDRLSA